MIDDVGYSIEEYEELHCSRCGGTEKRLHVDVDRYGYATVTIVCDHCSFANQWTGRVRRDVL